MLGLAAEGDDYLTWLRERRGPTADIIDAGLGCNGYVVRPWPYEESLHPSTWVTKGIEFLRRRDPTSPFFLTLSFHRPHPPIDPPQWCLDRYEKVDPPELSRGDWDLPAPLGAHTQADSPVPTAPRQWTGPGAVTTRS